MNSTEVENSAQRGHQVEHLGLDGRVQRGGRLVQDQQRRLCRQRHGDDDPLRHPAGQLERVPAHDRARVRDLHLGEHGLGPLQRLLPRGPRQLIHLGDLAADPDRGVQCAARLLVHHRHGVGPQFAQRATAHGQQVPAGDGDGPAAHPAVARQVPGQRQGHRGLAGTGLAHQSVGLLAVDVE
jgi:hypothetical protein